MEHFSHNTTFLKTLFDIAMMVNEIGQRTV